MPPPATSRSSAETSRRPSGGGFGTPGSDHSRASPSPFHVQVNARDVANHVPPSPPSPLRIDAPPRTAFRVFLLSCFRDSLPLLLPGKLSGSNAPIHAEVTGDTNPIASLRQRIGVENETIRISRPTLEVRPAL